jgi:ElaB/YqjD/DUF883 family membrane-anchored ribosome-binding protein
MRDGVLDRIPDAGVAAAQLEAEVERVKDAVVDALDDRINATKRAVQQGRRAVEDVVDDGAYQVKRHPVGALGVSFAIGLGLGAVIATLLAHDRSGGK